MATAYHNLSDYDFNSVPDAENMRFGIVVSEWNSNITGPLLEGAVNTLKKHGAKDENILVQTVPGSFELTYGSAQMIKSGKVVSFFNSSAAPYGAILEVNTIFLIFHFSANATTFSAPRILVSKYS